MTNDITDWISGRVKVLTKGSLVLCNNDIYSYQMKIGKRVRTDSEYAIYLVEKEDCPSTTTSKHRGLVRNAAISLGVPIIELPHSMLDLD